MVLYSRFSRIFGVTKFYYPQKLYFICFGSQKKVCRLHAICLVQARHLMEKTAPTTVPHHRAQGFRLNGVRDSMGSAMGSPWAYHKNGQPQINTHSLNVLKNREMD